VWWLLVEEGPNLEDLARDFLFILYPSKPFILQRRVELKKDLDTWPLTENKFTGTCLSEIF